MGQDSNPQHMVYKTTGLPLAYPSIKTAGKDLHLAICFLVLRYPLTLFHRQMPRLFKERIASTYSATADIKTVYLAPYTVRPPAVRRKTEITEARRICTP